MIDTKKLSVKIQELAPHYGIEAAVLFGSQARGEPHRESDIDIAVTGAHGRVDFSVLIDFTSRLGTELHTNAIEVVDMNASSPIFRKQIADDGIVLYQKSETIFANFIMRAYALYFGSKPFLRLREQWLKESLRVFT